MQNDISAVASQSRSPNQASRTGRKTFPAQMAPLGKTRNLPSRRRHMDEIKLVWRRYASFTATHRDSSLGCAKPPPGSGFVEARNLSDKYQVMRCARDPKRALPSILSACRRFRFRFEGRRTQSQLASICSVTMLCRVFNLSRANPRPLPRRRQYGCRRIPSPLPSHKAISCNPNASRTRSFAVISRYRVIWEVQGGSGAMIRVANKDLRSWSSNRGAQCRPIKPLKS